MVLLTAEEQRDFVLIFFRVLLCFSFSFVMVDGWARYISFPAVLRCRTLLSSSCEKHNVSPVTRTTRSWFARPDQHSLSSKNKNLKQVVYQPAVNVLRISAVHYVLSLNTFPLFSSALCNNIKLHDASLMNERGLKRRANPNGEHVSLQCINVLYDTHQ